MHKTTSSWLSAVLMMFMMSGQVHAGTIVESWCNQLSEENILLLFTVEQFSLSEWKQVTKNWGGTEKQIVRIARTKDELYRQVTLLHEDADITSLLPGAAVSDHWGVIFCMNDEELDVLLKAIDDWV